VNTAKETNREVFKKFFRKNHKPNGFLLLSVVGAAPTERNGKPESVHRPLLLRALPSFVIHIAQILEPDKIGDKTANVT